MATITSAQSGTWSDPATWMGGVVPDPTNDDVIIAAGHAVAIMPLDYLAVSNSHSVTVDPGGQLVIAGGLDVLSYGSLYVDGQLDIVSGGYVAVYSDGNADINSGGIASIAGNLDCYSNTYLNIYGQLTVETGGYAWADDDGYVSVSGGTVSVHGQFDLDESGYMDLDSGLLTVEADGAARLAGYAYGSNFSTAYVYGELTVDSLGYVEIANMSEFTCESSGLVTVEGYVLIADSSVCWVYGPMALWRYGGLDAWSYASLEVDSGGVLDDYGYLTIYDYGYLYVSGEVRVYRDIYISGQMYGGGKILMLRREGQIRDEYGNTIFRLDQAYGCGQREIA